MTEISRYRDGSLNSSDLIEDEMEKSGQVDHYARTQMHWRSDGAGLKETMAHAREEEMGWKKQVAEKGTDAILDAIGEKAIPYAAEHILPAAAGFMIDQAKDIVAGTIKAFQDADAFHRAADEEAVEVAAASMLELPNDFKWSVFEKHDGIVAGKVVSSLKDIDGRLSAEGQKVVPLLQASADAGSDAAFDAQIQGRDAYLRSHPGVAKRLEEDVAFKLGFDCAMSLKGKALDDFKEQVKARDARASAGVQVRA